MTVSCGTYFGASFGDWHRVIDVSPSFETSSAVKTNVFKAHVDQWENEQSIVLGFNIFLQIHGFVRVQKCGHMFLLQGCSDALLSFSCLFAACVCVCVYVCKGGSACLQGSCVLDM